MISACLLVYNHQHIIEKVIYSILQQSFSEFELIVSDDNSTDNSFEFVKILALKDKRIVPLRTIKNIGMAGNANFAVSHAKNEYIAILHHDDVLQSNTFQDWFNCIERSENIAFVFNDYSSGKVLSSNYYLKNKLNHVNKGKDILKNILLKQWGCPVRGTALIRKKYFNEARGMNEKFGMLADVDLWMRLASKYDVGYVDKPLIEVFIDRPENYPSAYTEFSWNRLFLLFNIHSSNINHQNYSNYLSYLMERFVFRNKVSFEIIKWHLYALFRRNKEIIKSFPDESPYELFYSKIIRSITRALF